MINYMSTSSSSPASLSSNMLRDFRLFRKKRVKWKEKQKNYSFSVLANASLAWKKCCRYGKRHKKFRIKLSDYTQLYIFHANTPLLSHSSGADQSENNVVAFGEPSYVPFTTWTIMDAGSTLLVPLASICGAHVYFPESLAFTSLKSK